MKQAVILAGGLGTRVQALVPDQPKPMATIAGRPLLEYIIQWLKDYKIKEIIFCLHYKSEIVKNYFKSGRKFGVKIEYLIEKELLGTGGAVKNSEKLIKSETFLVINGDTYFPINLFRFIKFHKEKKGIGTIALSQVRDVSQFGSVEIDKNSRIIDFKEKAEKFRGPGLVNGGVYVLEPEIFKFIKPKRKVSIERETFPLLLKGKKSQLFGYISEKTHFDIGTPTGYHRTVAFLKGISPIVIRSRAPLRIAFGGGGTDLAPYTEEKGGCVLNATINKYVYGTLQLRDDKKIKVISADYKKSSLYNDIEKLREDEDVDLIKAVIKRMDVNYGFELFVRSDVPPNTGLGSSASVAVAAIGLFNYFHKSNYLSCHEIAELAFRVEDENLGNIGGRQDQYAASYGGFNFFEFKGEDFVKINPLNLPEAILYELEKNLLLVYIGKREESGKIQKLLKRQQRSYREKEKRKYLDLMKKLAYQSYYALLQGKLSQFGKLLGSAWEAKKKLNPAVTNKYIDNLYNIALEKGALGGRVTGAGGGGHLIIYCRPNTEQEISRALRKAGAEIIDFSFEDKGLRVWEVKDGEF